MTPYTYPGDELDLFVHATNWKSYWTSKVRPCLGADVLEVGAGTGSNTALLRGGMAGRWVCLEPDPALAARIQASPVLDGPARTVEVVTGTVEDLAPEVQFDTVLYIDVLEHIKEDAAELARAWGLLRPGGHLIVLAPAHPGLFSPFDEAVGHYRRYTCRSLAAVAPPDIPPGRFYYLDSAGVLASLANRLLLRSPAPVLGQIRFWDRWLVPLSRILDPALAFRVGKSVIGIWQVQASGPAFDQQDAENK
ncbi:MAG: class I SAM-dependent methyltransferase [Candidatus Hydrogenedentes bacterium]|nr:class I SAM-dependent methyltransferase [Candidatus Hydrogenedentota bacterium]